jgi:hypothetical protein
MSAMAEFLEAGRVDTPVALKENGQGVLHRSDFFG